jgi:hypothetical protein
VNLPREPILIEVVAPSSSAAGQALRSYIDDVASSYYGRQATDEEIDTALREDPNNEPLRSASSWWLVKVARSWVAQA